MSSIQEPQTEGVRNALSAAEDFERKHYETDANGSAEELYAGDFKQALGAGADYVSGAVQNVKNAVVGEEPAVSEEVADASDAAHHVPVPPAAEGADDADTKTWMESIKDMGAAVANKVVPESHAMESSAGDKWGEAKKDAREGGQKLSEAAGEAVDALGRKTQQGAEHVDHQAQRAGDSAARGADKAGDQAKGAWQELKDVTGGAKDRVVDDAKDAKNRAEDHIDANTAGKYDSRGHQGTPGTHEGGIFQSIGNAVKSVADRFTAPVSGDEATDKSVIDKATGKAHESADSARGKAQETADSARYKAEDAKERAKGSFSQDTRDKAHQSKEEAKQAAEDAKHGIKSAAHDAKDSVNAAARDVKDSVKEKADEVEDYLTADLRPHTAEEAALQTGQIPSNTADVLSHGGGAGGISDAPGDIRATEQAQGMNIMADKLNAAVDLGYGEENLGADDAEDIRQATEGAGASAVYK